MTTVKAAWVRLAVFLGLWLSSMQFPGRALDARLDTSWQAVLAHAAVSGARFGRDVVYSYGPMGHLSSETYCGVLFAERAAWEVLSKAVFALVLVLLGAGLASRPWECVLYAAAAAFTPWSPDALQLFMLLGLGLLLLRGPPAALAVLAAAFLAWVSLTKFLYLPMAAAAAAAAACGAALRGDRRRAGLTAGSYAGFFCLWWAAAGQGLSDLPAFLGWSLEVVSGYSSAMSLTENTDLLLLGLAAGVLSVAASAAALAGRRDDASAWPEAGLCLSALFLSWKNSFVRSDIHLLGFFAFCIMLAAVTATRPWARQPLPRAPRPWPRRASVLAAAAGLAGLAGLLRVEGYAVRPAIVTGAPAHWAGLLARNARTLLRFREHRGRLEAALAAQRAAWDLPRTRAEAGASAMDLVGNGQGVVFLNGFSYKPRPVFQSFSAYTPALLRANAEFLEGPQAPEFVLFRPEPIDGRFPALEDGPALKVLLRRYFPLFIEKGHLLLKRRDAAGRPPGPAGGGEERLARVTGELGRELPVPDTAGLLWAEFRLRPTLPGRLLALLYKPPYVDMSVAFRDGRTRWFRLIPAMAEAGFLLSPLVEDAEGFLALYPGGRRPPGREVRSVTVRLRAAGRLFTRPDFEASFASMALGLVKE